MGWLVILKVGAFVGWEEGGSVVGLVSTWTFVANVALGSIGNVGGFVGISVGMWVGMRVGWDVGDLVGLALGWAVGLAVGFEVLWNVG